MPVRVLSIQPVQTVGQQDGDLRSAAVRPHSGPVLRAAQGGAAGAGAGGLRRLGEPGCAGTRRPCGPRCVRWTTTPAAARSRSRRWPRWTDADVAAYIERYDVPVNQLLSQGYGSVGCWPCTRKVKPGEDPRAGRWAAFDKTECGLHV